MICSECAEEPKAEGISVAMTGFGRSFEVEYFETEGKWCVKATSCF